MTSALFSSENFQSSNGVIVRHLIIDPYSSVLGCSSATLWSKKLEVVDQETQIIKGLPGVSSTLVRLGPWSKKMTKDFLDESFNRLAAKLIPVTIADQSPPRILVWDSKTLRDGSIRRA